MVVNREFARPLNGDETIKDGFETLIYDVQRDVRNASRNFRDEMGK